MTAINSYFDNVFRDVLTTSEGADNANSRWTDQSGKGNHIPYAAGVPTIATVGGKAVWTPLGDGTVYTEHNPPKIPHTVFLAVYHDSTGLPYYMQDGGAQAGVAYAVDDNDADVESWSWTAQDTNFFRINNTTAQYQTWGGYGPSTAITKGQWNIFTLVYNPQGKILKIQVNDNPPVTPTMAVWAQIYSYLSHRRRLGFLTTGAAVTGTFGYGQYGEVIGDALVEQPENMASWLAAAKTYYGIA